MATTAFQSFDPDGDLTFILFKKTIRIEAVPRTQPSIKQPASDASKITMLVSSKHLSLASRVFKAMLRPNFQEGNTLSTRGKVEVTLPDDNPIAFAVLMDIIHGKSRNVPKSVNVKFLFRIAILVDKYELYEPVAAFADNWMDFLRGNVSLIQKEVIRNWLGACVIFGNETEFMRVTTLIIRRSLGLEQWNVPTDENRYVPLPQLILDKLHEANEKALHDAISVLGAVILDYETSTVVHCSRSDIDCDSMILGSLIKGASFNKLWPLPKSPYTNLTLQGIQKQIGNIEIRSLCDGSKSHGLKKTMMKTLEQNYQEIIGLEPELLEREGNVKRQRLM